MKPRSALDALKHLRRIGPRLASRTLVEQLWYTKLFIGLRCDLENLPDVRPAKVEVGMEPRSTDSYHGFEEELARVRGIDYIEVLLRIGFCEAGVQTLYAAEHEGAPVYTQWLVRANDQDIMERHTPGRYPQLAQDEVLLEGAYTFTEFRRMGVMADGMLQLLRLSRDEGALAAITYVASDNVASLRGCAAVGFVPDHLRESTRRLGLRNSTPFPIDAKTQALWSASVGSPCSESR
jgi:hypothetical protein